MAMFEYGMAGGGESVIAVRQEAPIRPDSTSPVPAVASSALPLKLMDGVCEGLATMLPAPLRTTVT